MPTLKQTLLMDAASAALFVILCLGLNGPMVALTGLSPTIVAIAGWICVPCVLLFTQQAFAPSKGLLTAIVVGNLAWVLASVGVWLANWSALTTLGHVVLVAQAIAVESFAMLEWRGLKALSAVPASA
ncbi:hypothetical protein A6F68_02345 [Tsuneonella dongtanensis]|uniref:Uncharacterized protein n=1 Tax=Tsuneonella dongtanensis TaxID=692370 RepID=A0A1B2AFC9_9SPHN|nr:hypothetical protein [Tsuneonella dongtanensis]ANY20844.1 hypothetical protein A6F68_02345 [Tsuneonella dongtanensis]